MKACMSWRTKNKKDCIVNNLHKVSTVFIFQGCMWIVAADAFAAILAEDDSEDVNLSSLHFQNC